MKNRAPIAPEEDEVTGERCVSSLTSPVKLSRKVYPAAEEEASSPSSHFFCGLSEERAVIEEASVSSTTSIATVDLVASAQQHLSRGELRVAVTDERLRVLEAGIGGLVREVLCHSEGLQELEGGCGRLEETCNRHRADGEDAAEEEQNPQRSLRRTHPEVQENDEDGKDRVEENKSTPSAPRWGNLLQERPGHGAHGTMRVGQPK